MPESLATLRQQAMRHATLGRSNTVIPGVSIYAAGNTTCPVSTLYEPMLCLVLQGAKEIMVAEQQLRYEQASYFIGSVELPVSSRVIQASSDEPYLSISLALDSNKLAALSAELPARTCAHRSSFSVAPLLPELIDPWLRLLALLDTPQDIPVLAPMIEREILYRLLQGPQRELLQQIAGADSRISQVRRAIALIRSQYDQGIAIPQLAEHAGMSPASLHRHFKAATGMSPLRYQKTLRLQEARLRLAGGADVANAAFQVGYESPSQFSREYSRLFGVPPSQDARRFRLQGISPEQVGRAPW